MQKLEVDIAPKHCKIKFIQYGHLHQQPNAIAGEGRPGQERRLRDGHILRPALRRGNQRPVGRPGHTGHLITNILSIRRVKCVLSPPYYLKDGGIVRQR